MQFARDDCSTLPKRHTGFSIICAKVSQIRSNQTILVEDYSGRCEFSIRQAIDPGLEEGDYSYFLIDCSAKPLECTRITAIPPELYPVAIYQLEKFKKAESKLPTKIQFLVFEIHEEDIRQKIQQAKSGRDKEPKDSAKSIVGWVEVAMEQASAVKHGHYKVDCMPYRANEHVREHIASCFLLHHSNFPDSSFTVGVTPELTPISRLISDQGFDLILGQFSKILTPDSAASFEVNGSEYYLKDFRVRVGIASMHGVTKGVIVEMEFAPSNSPQQCSALLTEFVQHFFPNQKRPKIFEKPQTELYSSFDTIGQYLEIFVNMRRRA